MKSKIILTILFVLGLIFFPYLVVGGILVLVGILGIIAFYNIFHMMITGKGRGKYDRFN